MAVTVTRTTTLFTDVDGDGIADPGDTLRHVVRITNTEATALTGVILNDTLARTTQVGGSVQITPIAADDAFTVTANAPRTFTFAELIGNDLDQDGNPAQLIITSVGGATNGTVTIDTVAQTVTFTPTTGLAVGATPSFTYTVQDTQGLSSVTTGTVTLTVGDRAWFVDSAYAGANGASDGSYLRPFTSLAPLNGTTNDGTLVGDVDAANDTIFVYNRGTAYTGGITLEAGQRLFGDGTAFTVNGIVVNGQAGQTTIADSGAYGVRLASGNTLSGFDLTGSATNAIVSNGATVGTLTVSNVAVSGAGSALNIANGGTLNATFNSLESTGSSSSGILLSLGTSGTVTVTGATTANGTHTNAGISNVGGAALNLQGNVIVNTGAGVGIGISNTASITMSGASKDIDTTSGNAISMGGGTLVATGGGMTINTGSGVGLIATGGSITIAGSGNTIATSTGRPIDLTNVTNGGITLDSVAAGTVASNAISFNNVDGNSVAIGTITITGTTGAASDGIIVSGGSSATFNFGNVTIGNVGDEAVELNGANGAVTFTSLTATGTTGGNVLEINGATNSVTVNGGTLGNTTASAVTGDTLNVTGGSGAVTIAAALNHGTGGGNLVEVNGHATGTVQVSGALATAANTGVIAVNLLNNTSGTVNLTNASKVLNTGSADAISMTGNSAGFTANLTGGGLDIDTTTGRGINATGAGSLTIQGSGNTLNTTTGQAVNVSGVASGTGGITFQSIGTTGQTTGPAISLVNAGTGGFTVTGTGSTAASGGILNGATSPTQNQATGIFLDNVSNVSFSNIRLAGTYNDYGLFGDRVTNFTLRDSEFIGTYGNANAGANAEGAIRFGTQSSTTAGLSGTALFEGNAVGGGSYSHTMQVYTYSGTLNLTVRDSANDQASFANNANTTSLDTLLVESGGTAALTATVNGVDFNGTREDLIQFVGLGTTTQTITVTNNVLANQNVNPNGGAGILIAAGGLTSNFNTTYTVTGNTITGVEGSGIVARGIGNAGTLRGTIASNTIGINNGVQGTQGSSGAGNGIDVSLEGTTSGTLTHATNINNNTIRDLNFGAGIFVAASGAAATRLEATIQANTIAELSTSSLGGIYAQSGSGAGSTSNLGLNIVGNTITTPASVATVVLDQVDATAPISLPGYSGAANGSGVPAFLTGAPRSNVLSGGAPFVSATAVNGNSFILPVPLLAAASPDDPAPAAPAQPAPPTGGSDLDTTPPVGPFVPDPATPAPAPTPLPDAPATTDPVASPPPPVETPPADTPAVIDDGIVSRAELDLLVAAAIDRWVAAGITDEQIAVLKGVTFDLAEMAGVYLGQSSGRTILIDTDGAGFGWFVDATPGADEEYSGTGTRLTGEGAVASRIDLLTVLMHEMGHQLGLDDTYQLVDRDNLLYGYINPGERRLPGFNQAYGATPGEGGTGAFALAPVNVGTIPVGKSVEVIWRSTVDAQSNGLIQNATGQSTVSGSNFVTVTSNTETTTIDTLSIGNLVFRDNNRNGVFDAGDVGINGVVVSLFADPNNDGVADSIVVASQTTAGGGFYAFNNLAPGTYIVSIGSANFTGGGALLNSLSSAGGTDPDDNIDSDDNGVTGTGGTIVAQPITIAYNSEPTAGTGNDTNNTVDFGFLPANTAPTLTGVATTLAAVEQTPIVIDNDVIFTDAEGNFNGGTLVVSGLVATDVVSIVNQGSGAGQVGVSGATLSFGGVAIGTIAGGSGTSLAVTFNAQASSVAVDAVLQALQFNANSDTPATTRNLVLTVSDDQSASATATVTVNVTAVDDAPVAVADVGAVLANATVAIGVVTNDTDVDGGPKAVASVNGTAAVVGTPITLASGATVTLQADGTLLYNPNGVYNALVSPATGLLTGAVNTSAVNSFTYALNGGSSALVSVTVTGVDGPGDRLLGSGAADVLTGTSAADYFDLSQGGDDQVNGGDGNDAFAFGAAFTAADSVNGSAGTNDQLGLTGNYTGGSALTLGAAQVTGVEVIAMLGNNSYSITTVDDLVAAGGVLTFYSGTTGGAFTFNGAAETDGGFRIFGGFGSETLTGGGGNDVFLFGPATFATASTTIDGGAGTDTLLLDGDYTVTLTNQHLTGIEILSLQRGTTANLADYNITFTDAAVAIGQTLTVDASAVEAAAILNAAAETTATYRITGGQGADALTGGGGADWLFGNGGNDTLRGNGGADRFSFNRGTGAGIDTIADFSSAQGDKIELFGGAFGVLPGGALAASAFVVGTAATTTDHRIIYNSATGALFYDADGNGAGAAVQFATLTGTPALTVNDFVIV